MATGKRPSLSAQRRPRVVASGRGTWEDSRSDTEPPGRQGERRETAPGEPRAGISAGVPDVEAMKPGLGRCRKARVPGPGSMMGATDAILDPGPVAPPGDRRRGGRRGPDRPQARSRRSVATRDALEIPQRGGE